jgi:hypothetical protein
MKSDDSALDVGTFETGLGYLLPKLTSRYTDKIIALSLLSTRERIIKLKDFVNSVPPDTINKLGEFNGNIENIRNLLKSFLSCIEKIIYDETSLGLAGQCEKENRLRFSSIVANAIRSFRPHF